MERQKLLVLDGSCLLFQMFYGMPARINDRDGRPIHAVIGFVGALLKMIKMTAPDCIIAVFDGEHQNSRMEIDGNYKANRTDFSVVPDVETPFFQLDFIYRVLEGMGIKCFETVDCETDDIISSYVSLYSGDYDIIIASQDSDFFQLISPSVSVLRYRGSSSVIMDEALFESKFAISPDRYADYKAMVGDSSDNIRGIHGVGPKTAAMLINSFGGTEDIIASAADIKPARIADAVLSGADTLRRNYILIKLDGTHPVPYQACELQYKNRALTTRQALLQAGIDY